MSSFTAAVTKTLLRVTVPIFYPHLTSNSPIRHQGHDLVWLGRHPWYSWHDTYYSLIVMVPDSRYTYNALLAHLDQSLGCSSSNSSRIRSIITIMLCSYYYDAKSNIHPGNWLIRYIPLHVPPPIFACGWNYILHCILYMIPWSQVYIICGGRQARIFPSLMCLPI